MSDKTDIRDLNIDILRRSGFNSKQIRGILAIIRDPNLASEYAHKLQRVEPTCEEDISS